MRVTLKQRAKIWHNAGDTVDVAPAEAAFLLSVGVAEEEKPAKEDAAPKKTQKKKS